MPTFDLKTFKQRWHALCALKGADPADGALAGNIYTLVCLRAECRPSPALRDVWCETPDDGGGARLIPLPRPTETRKWIEVERHFADELDTLTLEILRELYAEAKEERQPETMAALDKRLGRPALWQKEYHRGHTVDVRILA